MTTASPPETFAAALRAHRARLSISQETLARVLGVSLSTLSGWERGRKASQLTQEAAEARLSRYEPGDARLLPNHLRDRSNEPA